MKSRFYTILTALFVAVSSLNAQVAVDFEGATGQSILTFLSQNNWQFNNIEVNAEACDPISGLQSVASGPNSDPGTGAVIITPFLNFTSSDTLSFSYSLHREFMGHCRRWYKLSIVDMSGFTTQIDSIEMTSTRNIISTNKVFTGISGVYGIRLDIVGDGCNSRMILDDVYFTGSYANINFPPQMQVVSAPSAATSVQNINSQSLNVYPNPASSQLNIEFSNAIDETTIVELVNLNGAKLQTYAASQFGVGATQATLNINELPAGNYLVSIKSAAGVTVKRFSKM